MGKCAIAISVIDGKVDVKSKIDKLTIPEALMIIGNLEKLKCQFLSMIPVGK